MTTRYLVGASQTAVHHWRKALGLGRTDNEGTRRLIHAAAGKDVEAVKGREFTDEECERRRANDGLECRASNHYAVERSSRNYGRGLRRVRVPVR